MLDMILVLIYNNSIIVLTVRGVLGVLGTIGASGTRLQRLLTPSSCGSLVFPDNSESAFLFTGIIVWRAGG